MNYFSALYKDVLEELHAVAAYLSERRKKTAASFAAWRTRSAETLGKWRSGFVKSLQGISYQRRVVICVAVYVLIFYLWQILAYGLPQTVFVAVNLLFVTLLSVFISHMLFYMKKLNNEAAAKLEEEVALRKKKEKEVMGIKSELHDLKMASRKQTTFGKNSQALIDSLRKNKAAKKPGEMPGQYILRSLVQNYEICAGVLYLRDETPAEPQADAAAVEGQSESAEGVKSGEEGTRFVLSGQYALLDEPLLTCITEFDGIAGQAIKTGKAVHVKNVPKDYINISSGLGHTDSLNLYVLPLKKGGQVAGLAEVASFGKLSLADIWPDIDEVILKTE